MNVSILNLAAIFILLAGCDRGKSLDPAITIVKYKNPEYNNYVSVAMKDSTIIGLPGDYSHIVDTSVKYCVRLVNDYFLGECCITNQYGIILNIKKSEWHDFFWKMEKDSLWRDKNYWSQYILDIEPYLEIWQDKTHDFGVWDSVRINEIIVNGELEKYFSKVK